MPKFEVFRKVEVIERYTVEAPGADAVATFCDSTEAILLFEHADEQDARTVREHAPRFKPADGRSPPTLTILDSSGVEVEE